MPILEDDKNELLRQYLAKKAGGDLAPAPYYQDPDASFAAEEASNRRELTGQLGTSLQQLIHGISGSNQPLDNSINQGIIASANEPIAKDAANQKSVRDYLEKKYEMGIKKQSLDKDSAMLAETLRHNQAVESLAAKKQEADAKKILPPGMDKVYDEQAKTATEWASGGKDAYESGVKRLDSALSKLENMKEGMLDKTRARFGENALSEDQLSVQQDIADAVLPALKATFPGNTSDAELRTLAKSFVDFRLSPKANAANVRAKMEGLAAKAATKEGLAAKFGLSSGAKTTQKMIKIRNPETGETKTVTEEEAKALGAM